MPAQIATWATLMVKCVGVLNITCPASCTDCEVKFVVTGNVLQQVPRPFEVQTVIGMQQQIGFECAANPMTIFNVWSRPAAMYVIRCIDTEQQAGTKERNQCCRLELVGRMLDEQSDLLGRFAAPALDGMYPGIPEVSGIQLANSIIAQSRAITDGTGPGLVPDHSQCKLELLFLILVTIVSKSHIWLFLIDLYHI